VTADERNERVRRAIEATVSGDTSAVSELFTADVVAMLPAVTVASRVELAVELEDHAGALSDVALATGHVLSSGSRVCTEWVMTAWRSDPIDVDGGEGQSPSGRQVTLRGATVAEFAGDRICALRHYWDETGSLAGPVDVGDH
jgi:ketosteroid isomerase-like protein